MTFLVIEPGGLYVEAANQLADKGKNKVLYWTNYPSDFPQFREYAPGLGFEYIEKVKYLDRAVEEADCIVNFDVCLNDIIVILRKLYPKKSIFGPGKGELLEDDRWGLKKIIKQLNLPLQKSELIIGTTALRNYISKNPDKFIKTDIFRSDISGMNSFYAKNADTCEELFVEIEKMFGCFKEQIKFIVENKIDTVVEVGFDGFFWGQDYVRPFVIGYEYSKACYIGHITEEMPLPIKETMEKFIPILKKLDYRGAISTEEKIISKIEHYFLDICSRLPAPCGAVYSYIKNWPEMIYKIGLRQEVKTDIPYKYVGACPIECQHAEKNWVRLLVNKEDREYIKFRTVASVDGKYYAVPGNDGVAVIIGAGNTVDEVVKQIEHYATKIDGYGLSNDSIKGLIKIKEIIEKGKKVGIPF